MTTLSQLVDSMVGETNRPDLLTDIIAYANQTIREMHFEPSSGSAVFYRDNFNEAQITADVETGLYWTVPNMATFQGLQVARFDSMYSDRGQAFAVEQYPGGLSPQKDFTWYRVKDFVFFGGARGYGGIGGIISLGWFEFPPALKYYASGSRPASYDIEEGWTYADDVVTDEEKEIARNRVSNWLLIRWFMVIEEGVRAKIYKRLADDTRAKTSYSLYKQLQQGVYTSEIADIGGPF